MSKYENAAAILDQLVIEGKIPGACLVINEGDKTVLNYSTGYADEKKTKPVSENTIYQLARQPDEPQLRSWHADASGHDSGYYVVRCEE